MPELPEVMMLCEVPDGGNFFIRQSEYRVEGNGDCTRVAPEERSTDRSVKVLVIVGTQLRKKYLIKVAPPTALQRLAFKQPPCGIHLTAGGERDFPYLVNVGIQGEHRTIRRAYCPRQMAAGEILFDLPGDRGGIQTVSE